VSYALHGCQTGVQNAHVTPQILAHRGGLERGPENTIAAFRQAFEDGADVFECDVRLTKDHQPIMIHTGFNEDSIQEVTGCTSPFHELTWDDVQTLKVLDSNEPVAHLDQTLSFVKETQLPCFIEPKEDSKELIPIVVNRIRQFNLVHKIGLLTFYSRKDLLIQAKQLEPKIQTSVIIINPAANLLKAAENINVNRIIIGWSKVNHFCLYNFFFRSLKRKVRKLKTKDIVVEGGFVRTQRDVAWLLQNEIGGMWTDNVPKIRGYLEGR
jgi:glycerophosphoryl diester phosphodiesterase